MLTFQHPILLFRRSVHLVRMCAPFICCFLFIVSFVHFCLFSRFFFWMPCYWSYSMFCCTQLMSAYSVFHAPCTKSLQDPLHWKWHELNLSPVLYVLFKGNCDFIFFSFFFWLFFFSSCAQSLCLVQQHRHEQILNWKWNWNRVVTTNSLVANHR